MIKLLVTITLILAMIDIIAWKIFYKTSNDDGIWAKIDANIKVAILNMIIVVVVNLLILGSKIWM